MLVAATATSIGLEPVLLRLGGRFIDTDLCDRAEEQAVHSAMTSLWIDNTQREGATCTHSDE